MENQWNVEREGGGGAIKWVPASVATLMMVVHTSLNPVFFFLLSTSNIL